MFKKTYYGSITILLLSIQSVYAENTPWFSNSFTEGYEGAQFTIGKTEASELAEGAFANLSVVQSLVNFSLDYTLIDQRHSPSVFAGLGYSSLLQFQVGLSHGDLAYRLKTELFPIALSKGNVMPVTTSPKLSLERFSIHVAQTYFKNKDLDHLQIGIGYSYIY